MLRQSKISEAKSSRPTSSDQPHKADVIPRPSGTHLKGEVRHVGCGPRTQPGGGGRSPGGDIFIELIIPHLRYIEFVCIFAFKTDTDKFCRLLGSTKGIVISEVNPEIVDYNIIEIMVNYQKPIVLAESTTQKADCRPNSKPCGRPCNPPKPRGSN